MHKFQFEDLSGSGDNGMIRPRNRFGGNKVYLKCQNVKCKFNKTKSLNEHKIDN